jgi:hypothetical protein
MSHCDGHATGGAAAPARPADGLPSALAASPAWEEVFPVLAPPQQHQLLDLARRQEHRLTEHTPPPDPVHLVLDQALGARLPPAPLAEPIAPHDSHLDEVQRDAVARAVHTPDLFLLQGPVGTGKSRVVLEVARQVALRGGRVLLASPDPAALDRLLPRLAEPPVLAVLRRLGPGESGDQLPSPVAALTAEGRRAAARESLVRRAAEDLTAAEDRVRRAEQAGPVWDELIALRDRQVQRRTEQEALATQRDSLTADIARDTDSASEPAPFYVQRLRGVRAAFARRMATLDERAAELQATRADAAERQRTAEAECRRLRPRAEALAGGRWFTPAYWQARMDKDGPARLAEAESRLAAVNTALEELAVREQKLSADRRAAEAEHAADWSRLIDAEVARRLGDLNDRAARTDEAAAADAIREGELASRLRQAGADPNGERAAAEAELAHARAELDAARGWASEVQARTDELAREACPVPNVVAGPIASLALAPEFTAGEFDLFIVDDAHKVSEADFLAAAALARRWVLVGEPPGVPTGRAKGSPPDLFGRLSAALRHDVWAREGNRLVCKLLPVRGADRRRLECEPVVDAPEIELRLFTPSDGDPALAEVSFPDRTTPAAAREYLCRELGEVTCQPLGRTAAWEVTPNGPVLRFGPPHPDVAFADIGSGVREELAGLETRAIHFDAGWSIEQARAWAAEHAGRRDVGRLARLSNPHRACPGLARWLNRAFATGFVVPAAGDDTPHVEFLAVPDTEPRRRRDPARPGRVGGAGYEIDLADPRQRATLPAELADLPATGYVNVPEAQALVRYLEPLAGAGLTVSSPFPAQVALLRKLLARSPRLSAVRVLDPAEAARAECDLLAVSLTRSHVARAVPFGDGPAVLAGLVGQARKKVLFAGDPGTLARRLQWEGPVDHLDAAEAARERAWVAALADCPRVSGPRFRPSSAENARA